MTPFLGGTVNGVGYCHTFSPDRPTCYESESRAYYERAGQQSACR